MATRHVLTVNQVLEIMLRWLEKGDWEKAFMDVIPKRKLKEAPEAKENEVEGPDSQEPSDQEEPEVSDVDRFEVDSYSQV